MALNSAPKPSRRDAKRARSLLILLYASTAGIAAASPIAVANSASAIPGATTARLVLFAAAIPSKLRMMPQTVPKRPINGAAEPSVARNGSRASSRRISAFKVSRIARSIRSRRSPGVSGWGRGSAVLSASPAESTRPAGSPASVASSSCGERAAAARASWLSADRLAAPRRQSLSIITAQLHTEAASSSSKTPLTTGSAFRNSLTTERDAAGSFKMASALHFIRTSKPGLEARKCGAPAALESLCQPREESAARTELRGEHAQPRARTYLVYLIEQVDDIEAQLQP